MPFMTIRRQVYHLPGVPGTRYTSYMKRYFAFAATLLLLGAGCRQQVATPEPLPAVPDIRVVSPANGSMVVQDKIEIMGTSNMPSITIDGAKYPVTQGVFKAEVHLLEGTNTFDLEAGTGFTTTTLTLLVSRQAATSSSSSVQ